VLCSGEGIGIQGKGGRRESVSGVHAPETLRSKVCALQPHQLRFYGVINSRVNALDMFVCAAEHPLGYLAFRVAFLPLWSRQIGRPSVWRHTCVSTKKVPCTASAAGASWTSFVSAVDYLDLSRTPGRIYPDTAFLDREAAGLISNPV